MLLLVTIGTGSKNKFKSSLQTDRLVGELKLSSTQGGDHPCYHSFIYVWTFWQFLQSGKATFLGVGLYCTRTGTPSDAPCQHRTSHAATSYWTLLRSLDLPPPQLRTEDTEGEAPASGHWSAVSISQAYLSFWTEHFLLCYSLQLSEVIAWHLWAWLCLFLVGWKLAS